MSFGPWSGTGRGWLFGFLLVLLFLVLDALVLAGSGFALGLLVLLVGGLAGGSLAHPVTLPLRRRAERGAGRGGPWGLLGFLAGLASIFGIVFLGSAVAGIPAFPTAESGNLGTLIYGFALGFGTVVSNRSLGSAVAPGRDPESRRAWRGVALVAGGVVAGLLTLTFLASVLIERVIAPVVRHLAA